MPVFLLQKIKNRFTNISSDRFGLKTAAHAFIGLTLYIAAFLSAALISGFADKIVKNAIASICLNLLLEMIFFLLPMFLYIKKILKKDLAFFRINTKTPSAAAMLVSVILPASIIVFYVYFTGGSFFYKNDYLSERIIFAIRVGLSAGVCEEVLFRGYIMKLIENRWNKYAAVFAPSCVFAAVHIFGGMNAADVALLFAAGSVVGILFSLAVYARDSINNAIPIHALWNCLILGIFNISPMPTRDAVFSYRLESNSYLLTGGSFGIESALPAIIGYIAASAVFLIIIGKKRKRKPLSLP